MFSFFVFPPLYASYFFLSSRSSANLPSFCFLSAPFPKLLFVMGRFQPRQLLHRLSGSELQLHNESSSNRSESSKVNRSHSSFHSCAATTSGCCCGAGSACGGEARAAPCGCCPGGSPTASPTLASSFIYFNRHVTKIDTTIFTFLLISFLFFAHSLLHFGDFLLFYSCTEFLALFILSECFQNVFASLCDVFFVTNYRARFVDRSRRIMGKLIFT